MRSLRFLTPEISIFLFCILSIPLLGATYIVLVIFLSRAPCVVLPSGYLLGYEAVFTRDMISRMTMISPMTLRRPDGEILVKGRRDVELMRDPQNPRGVVMDYYGGRLTMPGDVMMPLIWNKELFGHEWYEPAPGFPDDTDIISTDFFLIYKELSKSGKFERIGCGTPWFDWGE